MKIAICLGGQVRTGVECSESIKRYFKNYLNDIDFFAHTWDIETKSVHTLEEEGLKWTNENIIRTLQPKIVDPKVFERIKEIYKPISMVVDNFDTYQENRIRIIKENNYTGETIPLMQTAYEANNLKKIHENEKGFKYDLVIKLRYDQFFNPESIFDDEINHFDLNSDIVYYGDPEKKYPNIIEDVLWAGSSKIMDMVCDFTFEKEQGEPAEMKYQTGYNYGGYVWQIQMTAYLNKLNIKIKPFKDNRMSILRDFHLIRKINPARNNNLT